MTSGDESSDTGQEAALRGHINPDPQESTAFPVDLSPSHQNNTIYDQNEVSEDIKKRRGPQKNPTPNRGVIFRPERIIEPQNIHASNITLFQTFLSRLTRLL